MGEYVHNRKKGDKHPVEEKKPKNTQIYWKTPKTHIRHPPDNLSIGEKKNTFISVHRTFALVPWVASKPRKYALFMQQLLWIALLATHCSHRVFKQAKRQYIHIRTIFCEALNFVSRSELSHNPRMIPKQRFELCPYRIWMGQGIHEGGTWKLCVYYM